MSGKPGISSQIISPPRGGSALSSIDEKFAPDPHTGTGNFTMPIAVLPGRNGFQPELYLTYSTGTGTATPQRAAERDGVLRHPALHCWALLRTKCDLGHRL